MKKILFLIAVLGLGVGGCATAPPVAPPVQKIYLEHHEIDVDKIKTMQDVREVFRVQGMELNFPAGDPTATAKLKNVKRLFK